MITHIKKIEGLREEIRSRQAERAALLEQPQSRAQVASKVAALVAEWGAAARKQNGLHLRLMASGQHPPLVPQEPGVTLAQTLVLLLGEEKIKEALLLGIEDVPDGVPADERALRVSSIEARLDELELAEETLIEQAEEAGEHPVRRGDARPEIVLGRREPAPTVLPRSPHYQGKGEVSPPRGRVALAPTFPGAVGS